MYWYFLHISVYNKPLFLSFLHRKDPRTVVVHLRFKGKAYNNMRSDILQIIIDNAKRVIDSEHKELRMIGNLLIEPLGGTTIDVLNITLNLGGTTTIQPTKTVPPSTGLSIPTLAALFFMMKSSLYLIWSNKPEWNLTFNYKLCICMMKLKKYFLIYMYYSGFDAFSVNLNFIDVNLKSSGFAVYRYVKMSIVNHTYVSFQGNKLWLQTLRFIYTI